ncbi:MAG TPA: glycosyltransferase family 2 protein [Acidimicrobiales bacterium]|nr:glycosyltransferase family 2 protein [Acidimicrobiales bacterium]HUI03210.1 glycosyltransferase family 2 protein [Acidimicrobiales bacterium]
MAQATTVRDRRPRAGTDEDLDVLDVTVIVVTHESVHDIGPCLRSVRATMAGVAHEVVVVDNASTDGTAGLVVTRHPEARLVRSTRRQGFAANCNFGAAVARGRTLVFLNPDTKVTPGAVRRLVDVLASRPDVAVAGPRLVYPDGSAQASARRFPTASATLVRRTPLRWVLRHSAVERRHLMLDDPGLAAPGPGDDAGEGPLTVDWVLGAAVAIRTDVYRALGGMDDGYRLYCEDIDLCWRAWDAGFSVAYVPDAVVEHRLSELTRRRFLTRATVWHGRGMARFVIRNGLRPPDTGPVPALAGRTGHG